MPCGGEPSQEHLNRRAHEFRESAAKDARESAELDEYFDEIFSSDQVKQLKPAPEPYRMAAKKLKVEESGLVLVAVHS